jgi:hypothetical protein
MSSHQSEMQWFITANDIVLNIRSLNIFQANIKMKKCIFVTCDWSQISFPNIVVSNMSHVFISSKILSDTRTHVLSWQTEKIERKKHSFNETQMKETKSVAEKHKEKIVCLLNWTETDSSNNKNIYVLDRNNQWKKYF